MPNSILARLAPAVFVLLWATGFIGARMGAPYSEPLSFLSIRFAIVIVLLLMLALVTRAPWPKDRAGMAHSIVVGALIHGGYLGGVFWAIDRGMPAGVSALVIGLQPLLTALAAGPILGEKVTRAHWASLALGLAGISLVLAPKVSVAGAGINAETLIASIIGVVTITFGTLYQKRYAVEADLRTGGVLQYVGALAVTGTGAALVEDAAITWSGEFIFALSWLVLVLSIGAISLLMVLIRDGAITRVASLFYLVPALAALIAWFLFDETLSPLQLVGMAITTLAVALTQRLR